MLLPAVALDEGDLSDADGDATSAVPAARAQLPPPPDGWRWPQEGDQVEVEVEVDGSNMWLLSDVVMVLIDGSFQVRALDEHSPHV